MKKFYIDNDVVKVEISPTLVETLDESLDNMTLSLKIDQNEKPYEPLKHKFKVYDVDSSNNETLMNEFLISSDNVELVGVNPLRYKHTVSLIQTSQRLTKHLIRNSVFSNSLEYSNEPHKEIGGMFIFKCDLNNYSGTNYTQSIDLSTTKINAITLKASMFAFYQYNYVYYTATVGTDEVYEYYDFYVNQDKEVSKWSDIYKNNTNGARYPIVTFNIGGQTQTLQLTNFSDGDEIVVPQSIIDWIQTFSSGTLVISLNTNFPSNLAGWIISPFSSLNAPVFGKLTFDVQMDVVEMSVYEVIETLIKQYRKDTKMYHDAVDLFKMPDSTHHKDLYDLLKGTNSPNSVFTQASMFDALAEIFKLFDATFRIDSDGYLDIEYFNEHSPRAINNSIVAGRSSSLGEERYANRLLTYFQNTKVDDKFPNSNVETATAYIRSKTLGVPGREDFVFEVPKPIDYLKKVRIAANFRVNTYNDLITPQPTYSGAEQTLIFSDAEFNDLVDITESVVESSFWSLLPSSGTSQYLLSQLSKESTLSFEKGNKYIDVAKYYKIVNDNQYLNIQNLTLENVIKRGIARALGVSSLADFNVTFGSFDWHNVKLQVEYVALTDGKLVNESIDKKYDGEILTNQNNGSIDINKLGLNMVGLSLKLGQPTLTITQKFTSWSDRIKKGQFFIDNEGNRWVANNCSYTLIDGEHVQATIEFVKNFNGLASRIELNREKRLSNISNDLTTKCEENYGEFVYYCDEASISQAGEEIALKDQFLRNSLSLGFGHKIQETNTSTSYDASSLVVQETLDSSLDLTQYTKKQLVYLEGYVGAGVQISNPKGCLSLYENDDLTGKRIFVPISGGVKATLYLNEITKEFEMDYVYLNTVDFNTQSLTRYIETGHLIQICLIVDKGEILGGAIMGDSNVPGLTGWFAPNNMILRYPQNDYRIEYALLTALDKENNIISNPTTKQVKNIAVPMVVYGSGNSICFEMSFESPISAGNQLIDNYVSYQSSSLTITGWFSRSVLYTDEQGKAAKFTIDFVKMQEELTRYFPAMKKSDNDEFLDTYSFGKLEEFAYYKKPNEIFALNYQIHFLPYIPTEKKQTFLSNEYIKNNGFANGFNKKSLHIVYTTEEDDDNFEYSILDIKGHGTHTTNFEFTNYTSQETHKYRINFNTTLASAELAKIKTWAVVDEKNNIYFASNNTPGASGFNITFIFRHHRI